MQNKELNELLNNIFSNVNSWLNFAEAKNAANIAIVVACIAAILNFEKIDYLLAVICIVVIVSGICSLISFLPRVGNKLDLSQLDQQEKHDDENLLFFEDIKAYSGEEYVKKINKLYFKKNNADVSTYQLDLANEIVYNADIVSRKYKLFKWAVKLDIVAFSLFAVYIMCA